MPDGRVLFAGGFDGERSLASSELYDPAITLSSPGPPLSAPRRHHTAMRPAGVDNVFIFGDAPERGFSRAHTRRTAGAELFVPALNEFVPAREIAAADANGKTTAHTEPHVTIAALDAEKQSARRQILSAYPEYQCGSRRSKIGAYTPRAVELKLIPS